MNARKGIRTILKKLFGFEDRLNKRQQLRGYYRPRLEQMEERITPASFVPGSIQGQDGWSGGIIPISTAITQGVDQSVSFDHTGLGVGSLLVSNNISLGNDIGGFGGWPFSPGLAVSAGQPSSSAGADRFSATFFFKSGSAVADGSNIEVDLGTTAGNDRNTFLAITNAADGVDGGLQLRIDESDKNVPGFFFPTQVPVTGIDRTTWHRIDIQATFIDGPNNDTFQVALDGALIKNETPGSPRFDTYDWGTFEGFRDGNGFTYAQSNRLLFRSGRLPSDSGTFSDTAATGFYFDDVSYKDWSSTAPATILASYSATFEPAGSITTPVYVNASWANTPVGTDPDGAGPATAFGYDSFSTIQAAIDAVAPGDTVNVAPGTYAENLNVNKAVTLHGANAGIDPNTGVRGPETIVQATTATDALIEVTASNVTIDGFTIDGAGLATRDIRVNEVDSGVVRNDIITGAERAVQFNGAAAGNSGGLVEHNLIHDLSLGSSYGVLSFDSSYVSVRNNVMTGLDVGIFEQYFYQPNGISNADNVISGNDITAIQLGYGTNERAAGAAVTALSGDTFTITGAGGVGIQLYNIYKSDGITLTDETISGGDIGVYAFINGGSASITGGSISSGSGVIGVQLTNYLADFLFAASADGALAIHGASISGFATGVLVQDDPLGAMAVSALITDDTEISGATVAGIKVSGPSASADIQGNATTISGNTIGIDVDGGSANVTQNTITANGTGIRVLNGGMLSASQNFITGNLGDGILITTGTSAGLVGSITNNDLSGNTGLGVHNTTGVDIDASGNWWGTDAPAGVVAERSANVDYTPWLNLGTDTSMAAGFQGDFSSLHVDDDSPQVGATGRIQEAINLLADSNSIGGLTGGARVINVEAGTYKENDTVNKAGQILGPNAAFSGNDGGRGAEAIVITNGNQIFPFLGTTNAVFTVTASNVTIKGLTINGDDPAVSGIALQSGADANSFYGVLRTGGNNLSIVNNIIENLSIGVRGDGTSSGNLISQNWFHDIGAFDFGYAVTLRAGYYANITNNQMDKVYTGVHINNFSVPNVPNTFTMSGNHINSYAAGLWYNNSFGATPLTVMDNHFTAETGAVANNIGILISNGSGATGGAFTLNTITGQDYGVIVWDTNTTITLGGTNSITNSHKVGVLVTNNIGFNPIGTTALNLTGTPSNVVLDNLTISTNVPGAIGAKVQGNSGGGASSLTAQNDTAISGGATGILVQGPTASATITGSDITANGTGIHVTNGGILTFVANNFITNQTGYGIDIDASAGAISAIFNNDLSGNGSLAIHNAGSVLVNASGNWWGTSAQSGIAGEVTALNVDYTPWLNSGSDTDLVAAGFQGDFKTLVVSDLSPQFGPTGRITEAIGLVDDSGPSGGRVKILSGNYIESVDATAKTVTLAPGTSPGLVILTGNLTLGASDTLDVDIAGPTPGTDYDQWIVGGNVTLGDATLNMNFSYVPAPSDSPFVFIDNQGANPISGQFAAMPTGAGFVNIAPTPGGTARIQVPDASSASNPIYFILYDNPGHAGNNMALEAALTTGTLTPPVGVVEGDTITAQTVFTFTTVDPDTTAADFVATVNTGDAGDPIDSVNNSDEVQVVQTGVGSFAVLLTYTYHEELFSKTFSVTIDGPDGQISASKPHFNVADAPLTAGALTPPVATEGAPLTDVQLFHFTDANPFATASDYTATITWGDGTVTTVTSTHTADGQILGSFATGFDVYGSHTYLEELIGLTFRVSVTDHSYFNGFETAAGTNDWTDYATGVDGAGIAQVTSASGQLPSGPAAGTFFAVVQNTDDSYLPGYGSAGYTFFGGPQKVYTGPFQQSVAIYVNRDWLAPSDPSSPAFWLDMTPDHPPGNYGAEHNFRFYVDGSGSIKVTGDGGLPTSPIATITTSGWYTFEMVFSKDANPANPVLTDLNIYDSTGALIGFELDLPATAPTGPMASSDLTGHGYAWLTAWQNGFAGDQLAIDNLKTGVLPISASASINVADPNVDVTGGSQSITPVEGQSGTFLVATFTDPGNPNGTVENIATDYIASINWGDGTSATTGTITYNAGTNRFEVRGTHTYAEESAPDHPLSFPSYAITVTVSHELTTAQIVHSSATVSDPPVAAVQGQAVVTAVEGGSTNLVILANFTDPGGPESVNEYTADVSWGDGTLLDTSVFIVPAGGGHFLVLGSHTYAEESPIGGFTIVTTIHHELAPDAVVNTLKAIVSDPSVNAVGGFHLTSLEGVSTGAQTVATFTDSGGPELTGEYAATIDWGDGGPTSSGVISFSAGTFTVKGSHTYVEEGTYTIGVLLTHGTSSNVSVTSTASVADQQISTPVVTAPTGVQEGLGTGPLAALATFDDPAGVGLEDPNADFIATINWGDGNTSPGTVVYTTGNTYQVNAPSHTYVEEGSYLISVTVKHDLLPPVTGSQLVTVADQQINTPVVATLTPTEGAPTGPIVGIATFTDPAGAGVEGVGDFSATINWGDGSPTDTGLIIFLGGGTYRVDAPSHTYAEEGTGLTLTVTVTHDSLPPVPGTHLFNVADAALSAGAFTPPTAVEGAPITNAVLFHFTDADPAGTAGDYTATVVWGDGTTETSLANPMHVQVVASGGGFDVVGSHTYAEEATGLTFSVTVVDHFATTSASTSTFSVGDADLTAGALTPPIALEGLPFTDQILFHFTDANLGATASDYTALITWGDGHTDTVTSVHSAAGQIVASGAGFDVLGSHTYVEELASVTFSVLVTDHPKTAFASASINVADQQLTNLASANLPPSGLEGLGLSPIIGIATFTDPAGDGVETISDFTATINWGDATTSPGTIVSLGGGNYRVDAPGHTYVEEGPFTVNVTLKHDALPSLTTPDQFITIADQQLTNLASANLPASGVEGAPLSAIIGIATFTDPAGVGVETIADFTATINWGDASTSPGTIVSLGGGNYRVDAPGHTYAEEGPYTVNVTLKHDLLSSVITPDQLITIADADLTAGALTPPSALLAVPFTDQVLFHFTDANPGATAADFSALIAWGDGTTSTVTSVHSASGQIVASGAGFDVLGSHTYAISVTNGTFSVTVTDHPKTTSASATINVNGFHDDFNRSNSATLGANWTTQTGTFGISSNAAVPSTSVVSVATVNGLSLTDVIIQADVTIPNVNGSRASFVARYSGPGENNFYTGMIYNNAGVWEAHIYLKTATWTQLALQTIPGFTGTGHVRFEVIGTQLTLFVNNVLRAAANDSTIATAGTVGMRGLRATFDNFDVVSAPHQSTTLPYTDPFSNPQNGSDLDSVWTQQFGAFTIQGQQAAAAAVAGVSIATLNTAPATDVIVAANVNIPTIAGRHAGLVARYSGPAQSNFYVALLYYTGSGYQAYLAVNHGGVFSQLAVQNLPGFTGAGVLRFEVVGNQLKLFVNNVLKAVAYDSSISTPGLVGMRALASNLDNWTAATAAPPQIAPLAFTDHFTKPDNSNLDRVWTERVGAFTTQSGRAADASGLASVSLATLNRAADPDAIVQAHVALTAFGAGAGLVARYSGPDQSNFYLGALFNNNGVYQAYIFLNQGGIFTQLAMQNLPGFTGSGILRFEVVGSSLKLFVDNVLKTSATDFMITTPGLVGMRSVNASLDDFTA